MCIYVDSLMLIPKKKDVHVEICIVLKIYI